MSNVTICDQCGDRVEEPVLPGRLEIRVHGPVGVADHPDSVAGDYCEECSTRAVEAIREVLDDAE